jgi:hypothetical protein
MRKELHLNCGNKERLIKEVMKRGEDLRAQKVPNICVNNFERHLDVG